MFDDAVIETGKVSKKAFEAQVPQLRLELVNAQYDLRLAKFPVIIVVMGNDRIGANLLAARLNEWLDGRFMDTNVFAAPSQEERERPRFWRYWNALPSHGRIAIYGGAWPLNILSDRMNGELDKKGFEFWIKRAQQLEREWSDDGALILKFWLNLPKKELRRRLRQAQKDPDRSWWVEQQDWEVFERFSSIARTIDKLFQKTHSPHAPWTIVDGTDANFRDLAVASRIRDALVARLQGTAPAAPAAADAPAPDESYDDALGQVDLTQTISKSDYEKQLDKYQRRFHLLMRQAYQQGVSTVLAFEGWDAGGKGGTIRRLTNALPVRSYKVVPIAAPTAEEKSRHYLWRFWRHLPRQGNLVIFDRTWYGRVTVERIEGFATETQWQRAYQEINDFEEQLVERGMLVQKFWLHISPEEQLARFTAREETPYKQHKITEEDYRNRAKWGDYTGAVNEMVAKTSTEHAPWYLVPANDKRFARIFVLKTVCDGLERVLEGR